MRTDFHIVSLLRIDRTSLKDSQSYRRQLILWSRGSARQCGEAICSSCIKQPELWTTLDSSKCASRQDTPRAIVKTKACWSLQGQSYKSLFQRQIYSQISKHCRKCRITCNDTPQMKNINRSPMGNRNRVDWWHQILSVAPYSGQKLFPVSICKHKNCLKHVKDER
jgi:hypothetical protein